MSDISVIGLGDMGSALARAFMADGKSLTVWNRSPQKAEALVAEGAVLAPSSTAAIAASPIVVTCVKSHDQTLELLADSNSTLAGKIIIELSTGGAAEAEALTKLVTDNGADWIIGTISAYPSSVGKAETILFVVAAPEVWEANQNVIKILGGSSICIGDKAGMLAAIFAALFTTRQGFMFGLIYGALACRKAGIDIQAFSDLVPSTFDMIKNYHTYFADTLTNNFESSDASMLTYSAALDDVLKTFEHLGAKDDLPRLFSQHAHAGLKEGLDAKALTALIDLMDS